MSTLWKTKNYDHHITAPLFTSLEFFANVIPLLEPRVDMLGKVHSRPVIAYSDAEWSPAAHPPLLPSRGLGGCIWTDDVGRACSIITPAKVVNSLHIRETQIIPLELLAGAGVLATYAKELRGKEVILLIDNQSVCAILTKGISKSRDIQILATSWHLLAKEIGCHVWIEWVPSKSNPADILSREGVSGFKTTTGQIDKMLLPPWSDLRAFGDLRSVIPLIAKFVPK